MQTYAAHFSNALCSLLTNTKVIILNTPKLKEGFVCERERPSSFFIGVEKTNVYNQALPLDAIVLNYLDFTTEETYDGVHYTQKGNDLVFQKLVKYL